MGKTDPLCGKRYNKIRNIQPKKDLDKRRHRATNNGIERAEEPVSKPKYRRAVSQYTKAVREFGERRSEFESKDSRGTNCKRSCITKGRLTIPQMGIFMRSQMSEVAVRGGNNRLDEINQARLDDDLQKIIRLANANDDEAHPGKEGFSTLRERGNIMPTSLESDDQSDILDDPPTPRSEGEPFTFHKRLGANQHNLVERPVKEVGPKRFAPSLTSTVHSERLPSRGVRAPARRRLLFPRARRTPSDSEGEGGDLPSPDKENSPECPRGGRGPRLPTGCGSLKELYRTFASSYVGDVHQVYKHFVASEGHSSIQRTREELTASFRKTCERVLKEEGKSVDEENILNLTLQICGPDKYTSPKPGTVSSLRDYKQRNKELFPDTDSEDDEVETNESEPPSASLLQPQSPTSTNAPTSNPFGQDPVEYPLAPSPGPRPQQEEEEEDVFSYSPEVSPEQRGVATLDPLRFIRETLGRIEPDERRPSVFEALTPRRGQQSPRRPGVLALKTPSLFQSPPPCRPQPCCRAYAGARCRPPAPPTLGSGCGRLSTPPPRLGRPTGRYRLSSDKADGCGRLEAAASRMLGAYDPLLSTSPLTVHLGQREGVRARGNWDHRLGADNRTLMDEDNQIFRKLDCHMDDVKPRYVSPEQQFYRLCMF